MRILVIGYGSIGARHARILTEQGHEVRCVTRCTDVPYSVFSSPRTALTEFRPEMAIVSNATVDHLSTLQELADAGFKKPVLVEKPLFNSIPGALPNLTDVYVAYNLRFHPMIHRIRDIIAGKSLLSARFHVGQYLPDWRPGRDYATTYSANRDLGGGVLRDLSHELDLALWLTGPWQRVAALGGRFSSLAIDSDDVFSLLLSTRHCPVVSIHMDYLNRPPRRGIEINTDDLSLYADLIHGRLHVNSDVEEFLVERDASYASQLWSITQGETSHHCTYEQGMDVMRLIEAAEHSATHGAWMEAAL